ncbi:proteasome subunit alpha type-3-like [Tripterygium wilfordii]|uniref:Proteasome subunit alpha type-3 n=1 Tax=Tripterygium wilfordii TaxID=458696 RepID=A0A7J7DVF3_TRIWF|nr:proteasome subunit alpha type-3-like [Tripterygium wilfordii]
MSSIGTGYDLSVTTFSPDGRVFQVEYASKAVDNSGTVVGLKCKDGIVMGVEKLIQSKMMLPDSNRRIHSVHRHSGMAVAGLAADGRQIVARAKSEATNYEKVYGEPIPVKELADRVASYVHLCTLYWWLRPFGCGVILGGYDRDGPQLYMVEPSGVSYRYFGAAIGKGRQAAKTEVEKLKLSELTCRQGVIEVAKIIYGVHDEAKDKAFELEMSWICDESNRQHQKVFLAFYQDGLTFLETFIYFGMTWLENSVFWAITKTSCFFGYTLSNIFSGEIDLFYRCPRRDGGENEIDLHLSKRVAKLEWSYINS